MRKGQDSESEGRDNDSRRLDEENSLQQQAGVP